MNIESLKSKFIEELLESFKSDPNKQDLTAEDISIFEYADEFKDFVADEFNIDTTELSYNISDLLAMDFNEYGEFEYDENEDDLATEETNKNNFIASFLNIFLNDDKMKEQIDADGDGIISDEEKENFLNTIGSMDGDDESISMKDLIRTMKRTENDKFKIKEVAKEEETTTADNVESTSGSSGGYSSSSGGSLSSSSSSRSSSTAETSSVPDFSKMTVEEINEEMDTAETNLAEGQKTANEVLNGTDPDMVKMQTQVDEAYKNYQDELKVLDEDMAEQLDTLVENVTEAEKNLDEKLQETLEQAIATSEAENTYKECQDTTKSLEDTLSGLEGTLSSLQSALSGAEDDEKAGIESQIAAVEAQIASVKAELEAAKAAEEAAKTALEEAEALLEQLNEEATKLQEEVSIATEEKTAFEQEIAEKYPEIQELQNTYNECKNNKDKLKTEKFSEATAIIDKNQEIKNAAKIELNKRENKETQKEYNISSNLYDEEEGNRLVETAKEMLAKFGSTTGWCATGVSRTINMAYGISMSGNGCDWDTNMEKLVEKGMFAEVTDDYPSSNDLSSLPAGAIVCWEATTGEGNGGAKYGHVTVADGNGGEISDHYEKNIIKSVGGRSDQYRVFIPV